MYPQTGNTIKSNSRYTLDYSNKNEGYVIGTYTGDGALKCRVRISHKNGGFSFAGFPDKPMVYPLTYGDGGYLIDVLQQTTGNSYVKVMSLSIVVRLRDKLLPNLYPNTYVNFTPDSLCVAIANGICEGKGTAQQQSKAIYAWILKNIKYDRQKAIRLSNDAEAGHWFVPDPDEVIIAGKCVCFGYASLLAAMHRSQGIPCRIAIGKMGGQHAWNELYWNTAGMLNRHLLIPAKKFTPVDATLDISIGTRKTAKLIKDNNYITEYRG